MDNTTVKKAPAVSRQQCGTRAGHIQHYKKGEEYCKSCITANREYQKNFREKRIIPIEERVNPTVRKQCGTTRGSDLHYYHKEHPCQPCKIAGNERHKKRYEKATEEQKWSRNTKWRVENPEKFKEANQKWAKANPETIASKNRHQRAVKAGAVSETYTSAQILEIYGAVCHICSEDIDLEAPRSARGGDGWELGLQLDHVIPLSKGGFDTVDNVKPAHGKCNLVKRAVLYNRTL